MPPGSPSDAELPLGIQERINALCDRFEAAWKANQRPRLEEFLSLERDLPRQALLRELLLVELSYRRRLSERPVSAEYARRFPTDVALIHALFGEFQAAHFTPGSSSAEPVGLANTAPGFGLPHPPPLAGGKSDANENVPRCFGRYQVTGTLGQGGFGVVYRGHDAELRRDVAIKVPRRDHIATPAEAEAYLAEGRMLAGLDHPGIAPVYDLGRTEDGCCYIVSKFVPGGDLAHRMAERLPTHDEAAEWVARVAEALHHAHQRGLVHRDIKPGNILLDEDGHPIVADFGLALGDDAYGRGSTTCGTPAYMSPEQARGEGHRVDPRSDVYSLGVVFYELLTGKRPYRATSVSALFDEIAYGEVRPPRQFADSVPRELERICLKALSKRAAERYSTAFDLADDLRHWQTRRKKQGGRRQASDGQRGTRTRGKGYVPRGERDNSLEETEQAAPLDIVTPGAGPPAQRVGTAPVMPKGLRSFDGDDADFFLQLLPGPTDRDGLPECIRFWKSRVERTDADRTFSVGMLYGPSGCGKSSQVKAGLLPRLAPHVLAVYLEATADGTEARLLKLLRKVGQAFQPDAPDGAAGQAGAAAPASQAGKPDLPQLVEALAALRRGRGLSAGRKVLIVLDQFEQWLHAHRQQEGTELVRALRQCDGGCVQCVVMVRDDFWMAASRFLQELEIPLVEGENSAASDLFNLRHARRVLVLFGRAMGCLPEDGEIPAENEPFLDQAVAGLAEDGKVVPLRLALFAEMVKNKTWTPATLKEIGGIAGVGVKFLEETFSSSTSPPRFRRHQHPARAVLKALLPEAGADIRGRRRSVEELLAASGYRRRPAEFEELLRILDSELRLVSPADEEGAGDPEELRIADCGLQIGGLQIGGLRIGGLRIDSPPATAETGIRNYQLTHDYLVASLRDWLTRKQRETRRGRAELRLEERAGAFAARPDARSLPQGWEWLSVLFYTKSRHWSPAEKRVMRAARKHYGLRLAGFVTLLSLAAIIAWRTYGQYETRRAQDLAAARQRRAEELAANLFVARPDGVPYALENLRPVGALAVAHLRTQLEDERADPVERLHAAYALTDMGEATQDFLVDAVSTAPDRECRNLLAALEHVKASALPEIRRRALDATEAAAKARYAIVALQLGDPLAAKRSLAVTGDPVHRTALIHAFGDWHGNVRAAALTLRTNDDLDFRSGLCAALGSIAAESLDAGEREFAAEVLTEIYGHDPQGATHSAAGWALRQWKIALPEMETTARPPDGRRWFVNGQGMTMLEVPAGRFILGTSAGNTTLYERPGHEVTLTRPFFLSDCEVTGAQFQKFNEDPEYDNSQKIQGPRWVDRVMPVRGGPIEDVNWYEAVLYCNWLSLREGRRAAYERTGETQTLKDALNREYVRDVWRCDLAAEGYRLPTEAEWEYAAQAGSTAEYCFGTGAARLPDYAWYINNAEGHAMPVGAKRPNAWGLFDMHGNVLEWCWDWFGNYPSDAVSDPTGPAEGPGTFRFDAVIAEHQGRVLRGGNHAWDALSCRCKVRRQMLPMVYAGKGFGFRVACGR